jgi:hypothetical protein
MNVFVIKFINNEYELHKNNLVLYRSKNHSAIVWLIKRLRARGDTVVEEKN